MTNRDEGIMTPRERYYRAKGRYDTLNVCYTLMEARCRSFSKNQANREPQEGYEKAFQEDKDSLEVLRHMMREEYTAIARARAEMAEAGASFVTAPVRTGETVFTTVKVVGSA